MTRRDIIRGLNGLVASASLAGSATTGGQGVPPPAAAEHGAGPAGAAAAGFAVVTAPAFGAVGDGKTDDTAALRAAFASAAPVVYLPPGNYRVSGSVTIPAHTTVRGAGRQHTTILAAAGGKWTAPAPSTWVYVLGAVNADDVTVADLTVDARGEAASGVCILGGTRPTISGCGVRNVAVHSGCHFFGAQAAGVVPVVGGLMWNNVVNACTYNLVLDGQNEDCRVIGNLSLYAGTTHLSLDGGQGGGTGNHAVVAQGNSCDGQQGASNGVVCFRTHGATFADNTFRDPVNGQNGKNGTYFNIQESHGIAVVGNVLRTRSPGDYPAYGFTMGAVDVLASSNVVDGVDTVFFLIGGNASEMSSFHNTQVFRARAFQANNYARGGYEQAYSVSATQWDGRPYHPALPLLTAPPTSGVAYQNLTASPMTVLQPVYALRPGTPGNVRVSLGPSAPPTVLYARHVAAASTASAPDLVELQVPAAYYYAFTVTDAALGLPTALRR